jgi:hypothetical protein
MRLMICFLGVLLASSSADDTELVQARIARAMSAGPLEVAKSARIVDTFGEKTGLSEDIFTPSMFWAGLRERIMHSSIEPWMA